MNILFQLIFALIKILIMVGFLFNVGALLTWVDRRQSAMIQDRIGPNRAVIKIPGTKIEIRALGLIHTAADGLKFFFKEDFIPPNADKLLFGLAPILSMAPVLALLAVIPFGDAVDLSALWKFGCEVVPGHPLTLDHGQCFDEAHKLVANASIFRYWPVVPRFGSPSSGIDLTVAPARHRHPLRVRPCGAGDHRGGHRRLEQRQQVLAHGRPPRRQPDGQLRGHDRPLARRAR